MKRQILRCMKAYAGMVAGMDRNIGRLIEDLIIAGIGDWGARLLSAADSPCAMRRI
jgi:hypothetical protein